MDKLCITTKRGTVKSASLSLLDPIPDQELKYSIIDLIVSEEVYITASGAHTRLEVQETANARSKTNFELIAKSFREISEAGSNFEIRIFPQNCDIRSWEVIWPDLAGDGDYEIKLLEQRTNLEIAIDEIPVEKDPQGPDPTEIDPLTADQVKKDPSVADPVVEAQPAHDDISSGLTNDDVEEVAPGNEGYKPKKFSKSLIYWLSGVAAVVLACVIYLFEKDKIYPKFNCLEALVAKGVLLSSDDKHNFTINCEREITNLDDEQFRNLLDNWAKQDLDLVLEVGHLYNPLKNSINFEKFERSSIKDPRIAAYFYHFGLSKGLEAARDGLRLICDRHDDEKTQIWIETYCKDIR